MPGWKNNANNQSEEKLIDTLKDLFDTQSRQIAQVSVQVNNLVTQQEAMRSDFNAKWNELPKMYLSRQEDQARGLEGRIAALEQYRFSSTKDISDIKLNVQQDVQKSFLELQKDMSSQRAGFDARTISAWAAGFFLLINIVWSVVSHFILK